jgi:hypothetical protein
MYLKQGRSYPGNSASESAAGSPVSINLATKLTRNVGFDYAHLSKPNFINHARLLCKERQINSREASFPNFYSPLTKTSRIGAGINSLISHQINWC